MPIFVVVRWLINPDKSSSLLEAARLVVQETNKEKGCIVYNFHEDKASNDNFFMIESWATVQDLQRHSNSEHVIQFRESLRVNNIVKESQLYLLSDKLFNVEDNSSNESNDSVKVVAILDFDESNVNGFIGASWKLIRDSKKYEIGCLDYNLHQCSNDKTKFIFLESWESMDALEFHRETKHVKRFRESTSNSRSKKLFVVSKELIKLPQKNIKAKL